MLDGSIVTSEHLTTTRAAPPTRCRPGPGAGTAPMGASGSADHVADRLTRLESRVRSFGDRLDDTGEDLADTLEQLVAEMADLRDQVTPAEGAPPAAAFTSGTRLADLATRRPDGPAGPSLLQLYGTLAQATATSWVEHVVRPAVRRAIGRPMMPLPQGGSSARLITGDSTRTAGAPPA